jgi:hypothetical protein
MREAKNILTPTQWVTYYTFLVDLFSEEFVGTPAQGWGFLHSTAAQEAEAFLRTIGKWA